MAVNKETGNKGEQLAVQHILHLGYNILETNWRHRRWEIDIIAEKEGVLHFFEVKTRTSYEHGFPERNISNKKMKCLLEAATEYLYLFPSWKRIQFNALSIIIKKEDIEYFLIEDIFL